MVIVYVLQGTKRRYVGITNNLERRLREHASSSHSGKLIGLITRYTLKKRNLMPKLVSERNS